MRLPRTLLLLNALGALIAAGFSVAALLVPAAALPGGVPASALAVLYAQAYAARAIPLGAVTLGLLAWRPPRGLVPGPVVGGLLAALGVGGLAQLCDLLIGVAFGRLNMVLGGGLLAVIHLGSAGWLVRRTVKRPAGAG
jgi:hypothetical protein